MKPEELERMITPGPDDGQIQTGANVTLTIAVAALVIANAITHAAVLIVRAINHQRT